MTVSVGTSGFPKPVVANGVTIIPGGINGWEIPQEDFTPAADLFVQKLIEKNAQLKAERDQIAVERDQLASINARLTRKLANLRDGIGVLAERIKEKG